MSCSGSSGGLPTLYSAQPYSVPLLATYRRPIQLGISAKSKLSLYKKYFVLHITQEKSNFYFANNLLLMVPIFSWHTPDKTPPMEDESPDVYVHSSRMRTDHSSGCPNLQLLGNNNWLDQMLKILTTISLEGFVSSKGHLLKFG